jgi:hypothetical protein
MPATFGAAVLPDGVEAQADCVVQSLSDKSSVETYSYRNEVGVTVKLEPGGDPERGRRLLERAGFSGTEFETISHELYPS